MQNAHHLVVDEYPSGWWLCWPDGDKFDGPYKTSPAAKRALTFFKKGK